MPKPFTMNNLPPTNQRTRTLQTLFEADTANLKPYTSPHNLPYPLTFDLVPSALHLQAPDLQACLSLIEQTSGACYRASRSGWNERKKREEMLDKDMIYLLVRRANPNNTGAAGPDKAEAHEEEEETATKNNDNTTAASRNMQETSIPQHHLNDLEQLAQTYIATPTSASLPPAPPSTTNPMLGFTSFMFTYDDPPYQDRPVVYIYEIHLSPGLRGKGLGTRLLTFVEDVARASGIAKTMLTVFTANSGARSMYEKAGYERDESSPGDRVMRNKVLKAEYLIMSKMVS